MCLFPPISSQSSKEGWLSLAQLGNMAVGTIGNRMNWTDLSWSHRLCVLPSFSFGSLFTVASERMGWRGWRSCLAVQGRKRRLGTSTSIFSSMPCAPPHPVVPGTSKSHNFHVSLEHVCLLLFVFCQLRVPGSSFFYPAIFAFSLTLVPLQSSSFMCIYSVYHVVPVI